VWGALLGLLGGKKRSSVTSESHTYRTIETLRGAHPAGRGKRGKSSVTESLVYGGGNMTSQKVQNSRAKMLTAARKGE